MTVKQERLKKFRKISSRTGYTVTDYRIHDTHIADEQGGDNMTKKPSKRFFPRVFPQFFPAIRRLEAMCLKLKMKMVGTVRFERTTPTTPFSTGEKQKNKHIKRLSCFFLIAAYFAVVFVASLKLEQVIAGGVSDIFSANP